MPEVTGRLRTPRLAAPPTSPVVGEMYYDTGTNQLLYWNNTAWTQTGGSGGLGAIYDSDQIGIVKQWAGAIVPTNWLLCDGRSLSRTAYPDLFAALGGTSSPWGLPDASSFNIPDLRSRTIIGAGQGTGLTSRVLAAIGGEEFHGLTVGELPAHTHNIPSHTHYFNVNSGYVSNDHTHGVSIQSGGQSQSHTHNLSLGGRNYAVTDGGSNAFSTNVWNNPVAGHTLGMFSNSSTSEGNTNWADRDHSHGVNGNTGGISANHYHGVSGNTDGGTGGATDAGTGGGTTHNNMPPWTAISMIIKAIGTRLDSGLALRGTDGVRGTQWFVYTGTGVPPGGTFPTAIDGDMCVRQSDSEVFQRVSGVWADQSFALGYAMQTAARMYRNAAFTTVLGWNKIPLDTVSYDPSGNFQTINGRYVCPFTGFYQVNASTASNAAASEGLITSIYKNGLEISRGSRTLTGAAGLYNLQTSDVLQCNAGDYIELYIYDSVGAHTLEIQQGDNYLSVVRVDVSGRPGTSFKQYTGSGTPTISGIAGDLCMRTSDGEIFQMVAGSWIDQNYSLVGSNLNATCAARAYRSAALTVTANTWQKIPLDAKSFDPGNNVSLANGRYVCPVSGYYQVEGAVSSIGTSGVIQASIYKNGATASSTANASVTTGTYPGAIQTDVIQCNAGDYLELWCWSSQTGINGSTASVYLAVTLVAATAVQQHPLQPASQARAYRNAAFSLAAGTNTWTKIPIDTVSYDSGNNLQIANSRYVCPVNGYYKVDGMFDGIVNNNPQRFIAAIYRNGVACSSGSGVLLRGATAGDSMDCTVSDVVQCNAGDYLELWGFNSGGNGAALGTGYVTNNFLSVSLVGTVPTAAPAHAARAYRSAAFTPAASTWTKIPLDTVNFDPGGNFQLATGRYLCPITGVYDVGAYVLSNVSATGTYTNYACAIFKNGVQLQNANSYPAVSNAIGAAVADKVQCNAGDYLELWVFNSQGTAVRNDTSTFLAVSLLTGTSQQGPQGPQGIPGNSVDAKTAARAYRSAAKTLGAAGSNNKIEFDAAMFDAGNNLVGLTAADGTANKGRYVCPVSGFYQVNSEVGLAGLAASADCSFTLQINVNGSMRSYGSRIPRGDVYGQAHVLASDIVQCSAGDYIEMMVYTSVAGISLLGPGSSFCFMSIVKVDTGGPPGPAGGAANMVQQIYAMTGYTPDRTMNPSTTSLGEVAAVLATLIDDLKTAGLLHA